MIMNVYKYFNIDLNKKEFITLVGGGGKTTTMFRLAKELKSKGKNVLVTTTTAIFKPHFDSYDNLIVSQETINFDIKTGGSIIVLGRNISKNNKLLGINKNLLNSIYNRNIFDYIICEGDGSKRKAIKAPDKHEPVIPDNTSMVIGVIGLDSIGKPIAKDYVHRPEILANILNKNRGEVLGEKDVYRLIVHKDGLFRNSPQNSKKYVLLNKADKDLNNSGDFIKELFKDNRSFINGIIVGSMKENGYK